MEKTKTTNKPTKDEVLQEFPPLGKYRVRLLKNSKRPSEAPVLDIREFISSETFEGFTRRGVRLGERLQMDQLREVLRQILEATGFAASTPAATSAP